MWYSQYRGRSIGRVIHFLKMYCGLRIADHIQIGNGEVTLHREPFATFKWESIGRYEYPVFEFPDDYKYEICKERQARTLNTLREFRSPDNIHHDYAAEMEDQIINARKLLIDCHQFLKAVTDKDKKECVGNINIDAYLKSKRLQDRIEKLLRNPLT